MNNDKVVCGSVGLYPSYATSILNSVEEIHFYVLCSEKLNYADYIKKCIAVKELAFLISRIQEIISSHHLVVTQLQYRLKQDNFQNYHPNLYLQKVY